MIKLVAFDWNGTLIADTKATVDSVNEAIKLFPARPITVRDFQKNYDVPIYKFYQNIGVDIKGLMKKSRETQEVFHSYYEKRASKLSTRTGTRELLKHLSKEEINSIIFSNHIAHQIAKQLKRLDIDKYFIEILANDDLVTVLKSKTKEQKFKEFVSKSKFKPKEILIVGDYTEEVEIGKRMGAVTVAITNGVITRKRLKSANPDYLINNLQEVIGIITKLNG